MGSGYKNNWECELRGHTAPKGYSNSAHWLLFWALPHCQGLSRSPRVLATSLLASTLEMPVAQTTPTLSCDNQEHLQTWPNSPTKEWRWSPGEIYWLRDPDPNSTQNDLMGTNTPFYVVILRIYMVHHKVLSRSQLFFRKNISQGLPGHALRGS